MHLNMLPQELFEAQSRCSPVQHNALSEPQSLRTDPSAPQPIETLAPDFLAALWRMRLEFEIFKLERRALPILNVFHRLPSNDAGRVVPLPSCGHSAPWSTDTAEHATGASFSPGPVQSWPEPELVDTTNHTLEEPSEDMPSLESASQSLGRLRRRGTWFKWRGPLPMKLRRSIVRGSCVFVHRYRVNGRWVTRFWVRERVEGRIVRWRELRPSLPHRLSETWNPKRGQRGGVEVLETRTSIRRFKQFLDDCMLCL